MKHSRPQPARLTHQLRVWWPLVVLASALVPGCIGSEFTACEGAACADGAGGAAGEGPGGRASGGSAGSGDGAGRGGAGATGSGGTPNVGGTASTGGGGAGGSALTTSTSAGGTSGSGGGSSGGVGGTSVLPCNGACGGATPVCDEAADTCVGCLEDEDCAEDVCDEASRTCVECVDSDDCSEGVCDEEAQRCVECVSETDCAEPTPLCEPEEQVCVECLANSDCAEATASWCDAGSCSPCQTNLDCAHLADTPVCDAAAGECVECTGTDYESCGTLDGTPLVCDSLERSCTTEKRGSVGVCGSCVSDAQCRAGQRCVKESFEGTELGYRCFWERGSSEGGAPAACSSEPPYISSKVDATSIDGATADICTLAVSTCKAHEDFRNVNCEVSENVPDASLCGEAGLNDSGCEFFGTVGDDNIYRCTVRCSSDDDCRVDHECDISASPPVCFLNP